MFSSPDDGLRFSLQALRVQIEARLARSPGVRQQLVAAPADRHGGNAVEFDLAHHVRGARNRSLESLVDEAMATPLAPERPPWELWIAERLDDRDVGVVAKAEPQLAQALDPIELMALLFDITPDDRSVSHERPQRTAARVVERAEEALRAHAGHAVDLGLLSLQYARNPAELRRLPASGWQTAIALTNRALAATTLTRDRPGAPAAADVFDAELGGVRLHMLGCELRYAQPIGTPAHTPSRSNRSAPHAPPRALPAAAEAGVERGDPLAGLEAAIEEFTTSARAGAGAGDQISYRDLYARWEKANWQATQIDFAQDRVDWHERLTRDQRRGALWLYSLFFHGEHSVANSLGPYVDAAPLPEQKYLLLSQQIDEGRHAVFFARFMHEVVEASAGEGDIDSALKATASQLGWGHHKFFARLERMTHELDGDRSPRKLAAAVTLYHIVGEATLAQPGQHMIEAALERLDLLPGFREGMRLVALDEQRHIALGVRLLADLYRDDPRGTQDAIVDTIRDALPATLALPVPPRWDRSYTECFGFTLEDLYEDAARAQEAKLRAIGLPLEQIPHLPLQIDLAPRERGRRAIALLQAGMLGPRETPLRRDCDTIAILFDELCRQARGHELPANTTIQLDFIDAEPWYLRLDASAKEASQGRLDEPSVRLRVRFEDFVDLVARRSGPRALMLRGRLQALGDPRVLARLPRLVA